MRTSRKNKWQQIHALGEFLRFADIHPNAAAVEVPLDLT
jgi:hypothetical protein